MDSDQLSRIVRSTLVVLLLVGLVLLLPMLSSTLLLIFAAILLAVLFRAAALPFQRLRLNETVSVLLGALMIVVVVGLLGWLFGARIAGQLNGVVGRLPHAWDVAQAWIRTLPFGPDLLSGTPDLQGVASRALSVAYGAAGVLTNLVLVLVGAVYLALEPDAYIKGIRNLFPRQYGESITGSMLASGRALRSYLLGQLFTMAFVGTLVAVGLTIVGVPSALALGLIVGVANFIPLLGSFIGATPGVLLAFSIDTQTGIWATLVYFISQQIEGNVLTPIVQRHAVQIPPALFIFSLAALGALFGTVGILVSAPLAVVIYTLVTKLWSKEALGHDVTVPGEG